MRAVAALPRPFCVRKVPAAGGGTLGGHCASSRRGGGAWYGSAVTVGSPSELIRPPRLRPGDRVAFVSPSSGPPLKHVRFRGALKNGIAFFEQLGLRPFLSRSAQEDPGYLARDIELRAGDLSQLARDPDVRGIFCLAGGASGMELLASLDYAAFRADPKVLVGFSDATAFLDAITLRSGVVTFYGENVLFGYADRKRRSFEAFQRTLMRAEGGPIAPFAPREGWRGGQGEGPLWGGNLYTVRCLLGTPFCPDYGGAVLFWEETGEAMDDLNSMLWQLRLSGTFDKLSAMVVGDLPGMRSQAGHGPREIVLRAVAGSRFPVMKTRDFGHWRPSHILPIGVRARVDADRLEWEAEPGVS